MSAATPNRAKRLTNAGWTWMVVTALMIVLSITSRAIIPDESELDQARWDLVILFTLLVGSLYGIGATITLAIQDNTEARRTEAAR